MNSEKEYAAAIVVYIIAKRKNNVSTSLVQIFAGTNFCEWCFDYFLRVFIFANSIFPKEMRVFIFAYSIFQRKCVDLIDNNFSICKR